MRDKSPILIGVTGGIGAGKSVVCRVCSLRGIPLYDCDYEARRLMDTSPEIHRELRRIAGDDIVGSDGINRNRLAVKLFGDSHIRKEVNELVHTAARRHLRQRISESTSPLFMVESAILHTSRLDEAMHHIWLVEAPLELRIARVHTRNGLPREQILDRMAAQEKEFDSLSAERTHRIINDGVTPLLPQIDSLLNDINI